MSKLAHRTAPALLLALVLVSGACAPRARLRPPAVAPPDSRAALTLLVRTEAGVERVPLEEYVAGCIVAELGPVAMPAEAAARARDVQAILCRSFAMFSRGRHAAEGFDLCATTHCQVYGAVPDTPAGRLAREAAIRTAGLVLTLDGAPVRPLYHADCGGHTSSAREVWGGDSDPHLVGVVDDVCVGRSPWRLVLPLTRLSSLLAADTRTAVAGRLRSVEVARRDSAGRAQLVRLAGDRDRIVRGSDFRMALLRTLGPSSLQSTLFTVAVDEGGATFVGRGNGHGVGLCQHGALARAARGDAPSRILAHYFPGVRIAPMPGVGDGRAPAFR